jgi:hypothetical protein
MRHDRLDLSIRKFVQGVNGVTNGACHLHGILGDQKLQKKEEKKGSMESRRAFAIEESLPFAL